MSLAPSASFKLTLAMFVLEGCLLIVRANHWSNGLMETKSFFKKVYENAKRSPLVSVNAFKHSEHFNSPIETECKHDWAEDELKRFLLETSRQQMTGVTEVEYDDDLRSLLPKSMLLEPLVGRDYVLSVENKSPLQGSCRFSVKESNSCPHTLFVHPREKRYPYRLKQAFCNCSSAEKCIHGPPKSSCEPVYLAKPVLEKQPCNTVVPSHKWVFKFEKVPTSCACKVQVEAVK